MKVQAERGSDMDVKAVYEFPVPIWLMCVSLGRAYGTGYGPLRFDVVMPENVPPFGGPPAVEGAREAIARPKEQVVWAQEYAAFIPDSLQPATAVHRVALTAIEGPSYDDRSWLTLDNQLAQSIDRWFDNVRTWAEIVTGQDLDPRHQVYDAETIGAGLTFIEPPRQDAQGLRLTTRHVSPLREEEWATILDLVREGTEPPLEEVLSRDARAAQRRGANRRAVLDAATALEIGLGRHIRSLVAELPERQQNQINERTALGGYISIAEHSHLELAVDVERLREVNKLRNDAAHRGEAPDSWAAVTAVQVMMDFLGAHGRYRRTGTSELDGGELVLGQHE